MHVTVGPERAEEERINHFMHVFAGKIWAEEERIKCGSTWNNMANTILIWTRSNSNYR